MQFMHRLLISLGSASLRFYKHIRLHIILPVRGVTHSKLIHINMALAYNQIILCRPSTSIDIIFYSTACINNQSYEFTVMPCVCTPTV